MSNRAVHEALAFEHALASKGRGHDLDREMTAAARDRRLRAGDGSFDCLPKGVDD